MIKVIYVSGPISDGGRIEPLGRSKNREAGRKAALNVWLGVGNKAYVICPHINSPWADDLMADGKAKFEDVIKTDLDFIECHVDALYMMPTWKKSKGAVMEHDYAKKCGIPIFYEESKIIDYICKNNSLIECTSCGHLRYGMKTLLGRKVCKKCFDAAEKLSDDTIKDDRERYIPIPRMN